MNATLSVLLSLSTVLAGGAAALLGDVFEPTSAPVDDCPVADLCTGEGHGNQTAGNQTEEPSQNSTAPPEDPEPEPADEGNETGHYHHHHYENGTADDHAHGDNDEAPPQNSTAEPQERPEDVHFCTNGFVLLGEGYTFTWDVYEGFELFELDWHYQGMTFGLLESKVSIELLDGAGQVVLSLEGEEADYFSLDTEDLRGYAPGEWTFIFSSSEAAANQGLVGSVEY